MKTPAYKWKYEDTFLVALGAGLLWGLASGSLYRQFILCVIWHNRLEVWWQVKDMGYKLDCALFTGITIVAIHILCVTTLHYIELINSNIAGNYPKYSKRRLKYLWKMLSR